MEILLFFGIVLVVNTNGHDVCPNECFCNHKFTSVNCEGHKLTAIPKNLPKSIEVLYFGHNYLRNVNLTGNDVLPNLKELRLDNNKISELKYNTFNGDTVPKLSVIYMRNNRISVVESKSFVNLSLLNDVYLTNNIIQRIEPDAFFETPFVEYINLDGNSLSAIPQLGRLQKLQSLYIEANQITNPHFPEEYRDLVNLIDIGLSNNKFQKIDNTTFENLKYSDVRKLELSRNKMNQVSRGALQWFRNIQSLKIGYNPLTSSDLETAFYGLVGSPLTSLNINNVSLGGHLPSSTFQLLRNTSIKYLIMKNNQLNNIPEKGFADLRELLTLDISAGRIFTISDSAFEGLDALIILFLNDNQISHVPKNLPPSLQRLYLNGNQITSLRNNEFSNLNKLQLLYLGNNKIVTLEKNAFYGLTSLKKIHLVQNIIGTLPGNIFAPFTVLESLELNKNNIKTIPNDQSLFSSMSSLLYLNLADNGLSKCPLGLFSVLQSLQYLHLENNKLGDLVANDDDGMLFVGLDKLLTLDLTNNQLAHLPDPLFKDLTNLQNLTLRNNKLSTWGNNLFKRTVSLENIDFSQNLISLINSTSVKDFRKMQTLDLRKNPFACTCDLRWFRDWMKSTNITLVHSDTYLCNTPSEWHGKKLLSFDRTKIRCKWFTEWQIILASLGSIIVLSVIIIIVYRRRWYIRLRYYRFKRYVYPPRKKGYEILDGDVKKYDAYVSYAADDYQWVKEHLLPDIDDTNYENQNFGGEFKLFVDDVHSDADIGKFTIESIFLNMEASRVVLIVLSNNYIKSDTSSHDTVFATELLHYKKTDEIIILNIDGLKASCVPDLLRNNMEINNFISWENKEEAILTFKEQLKYRLGRKPKIQNIV